MGGHLTALKMTMLMTCDSREGCRDLEDSRG